MHALINRKYELHKNKTLMNTKAQFNIDSTLLRGELRRNVSMARYTSWKTGGLADLYYRPADIHDLSKFISQLPDYSPVIWLGFGSNLLVRDGGIEGVVISVVGVLEQLGMINELELKIDAGVSCVKAARYAAKQGLTGIEFLAGIPGTIGGALAMNAGAYGGEIWSSVLEVETIDRTGKIKSQKKESFEVAYRSVSSANEEWFLSTVLKLERSDKETIEDSIRGMLSERAEAQPLGQHSCGSVFRNPPNDYAARLIDSCGLKGKKIGGACVSDKHANFIINFNNATSLDIEQLIKEVQSIVYEKHGVKLEPEVKIIGKSKNEDKESLQ